MAASIKDNRRKRRKTRKASDEDHWDQNYPYDVDYNDHFETPLVAYEDIAPLLDWLSDAELRKENRIYDPYYCNGQTKALFRQLGFHGIINRKRDFYVDHEKNMIPDHDVFVTNPPYSDKHKIRCLDVAFSQLRRKEKPIPFLCLMPNYVALRDYFKSREEGDCCFLIPSEPYEYSHPEGTGKDVPPFSSLWFCGIGKERMRKVKAFWAELSLPHHSREKPALAMSLDDLKAVGAVPTEKRGNPRQRKKRREHAQQNSPDSQKKQPLEPQHKAQKSQSLAQAQAQAQAQAKAKAGVGNLRKAKPSKYRDGTGKRQRKRF